MIINYVDIRAGWGRCSSQPGNADWWALSLKLLTPALCWICSAPFQREAAGEQCEMSSFSVLPQLLSYACPCHPGRAPAAADGPSPVQWQCRAGFRVPQLWGANTWQPVSAVLILFCSGRVGRKKDVAFPCGVAWHKCCVGILFQWSVNITFAFLPFTWLQFI